MHSRLRMTRSNPTLLTLATFLALAACGGDEDGDGSTGPGPTPGSVQVTASTTGEDPDPDGFTVTLDSSAGQALGVNATATFADVEPGDHELELEDVAANCTVNGENPRAVSVTAAAVAEVTFDVLCTALSGPPAALAFTAEPAETELHQPIAAVEVTILDEDGEPVSTATQEVTVTLGANPGDSAPTEPVRPGMLGGTTTVSAVDGVARFDDLAIDRRGSGYTLVAEAEGLEGAESEPFDVTFAWEDVTAGSLHTCGWTPGGVAYCWGLNNRGQLGDGRAGVDRDVPVAVATELGFVQLSAGSAHTCGRTASGVTYCWGRNLEGQLGDGRAGTDSSTPSRVEGGIALEQVSAGDGHTCALTSGGVAYCWGDNRNGQLGDGNAGTDSDLPVAVDTDLSFEAIAAGLRHTCAHTGTDAYCWGGNAHGQLGDSTLADSALPVLVKGEHSFVAVGVGFDHSCALGFSGGAFCWGNNASGQLGNGNVGASSAVPVPVAGDYIFRTTSLTVGGDHACADRVSASASGLHCWGDDTLGQLGDGSGVSPDDEPVPVEGGAIFSGVDAGDAHTCGVTPAGEAYCWGDNGFGQLGDGNAGTDSDRPVGVLDPP